MMLEKLQIMVVVGFLNLDDSETDLGKTVVVVHHQPLAVVAWMYQSDMEEISKITRDCLDLDVTFYFLVFLTKKHTLFA